ncbi:MAG: N,N'-diacetylchitobiose phosphorylase [Melioribacteraceae bacterium]
MQYGYFDDEEKEYVITKPNTPRSWSNYLGNTEYGIVITNNAGGYSFYKSGGQGRTTRFRFNSVPMDQPGRYLYIRDNESKDYWTTSWQPIGKPLDKYKSEVRFGTGYAIFDSEYDDIKTQTKMFVPLGKSYECWSTKIKNIGSTKRKLSVFTYVEFPGNWNALDDMLNLQYTQYTVKMDVIDNIINHGTNVLLPEMPDDFDEKDQQRNTFMAVVGADIVGFETDREKFLGSYRTYSNPLVVENGKTTNSLAFGENACGVLQIDLELEAGEEKDFLVLLGIGKANVEGKKLVEEYKSLSKVNLEFSELKSYWHARMNNFSAETPDPAFNSMINTWNPYNSLITFAWSRAASLIYTADERDGLGYRDSVQDILGVVHNITEEAKERLELLITGQCSNGGAMPVVKQFSHKPGKEKLPQEDEYRSDDCLWLFNSVPAYVKETGEIDFYKKVLPYADRGDDTVFNHLKRAIKFNFEHSGKNGLPSGLKADWNDCLRFGSQGESMFVAFQLRFALKNYIEIGELLNEQSEIEWGKERLTILDKAIDIIGWDGNWYIRGIDASGNIYGSNKNEEGKIFMNPQAWSVISGHASEEKAVKAMKAVNENLATEYGIQITDPPYLKTDYNIVRARFMNPGTKENAGIFQHTQGWAVIAEAMMGNGSRAYEYHKAFMPATYNDKAEVREIEPYVYAQSTLSKHNPHFGKSRVPWLSGSATWAYYSATQYILGIQPHYNYLLIDPCIPSDWKTFSVSRIIRGKELNIKVENPNSVEKGVVNIILNGSEIESSKIPYELLKEKNDVIVNMGE